MQRKPFLVSVIVLPLVGVLAAGCASTSHLTMPSPAGAWDYLIPNTPNGEATGTLMIAGQGERYSGEMYIDIFDQHVPMQEVAFTNSTFTFKATLEANGQRMSTATRMTLNGDAMRGVVEVEGIGALEIVATRKRPEDGP